MTLSRLYLPLFYLLNYLSIPQHGYSDKNANIYVQTFKEHEGYISDKWDYYLYFYESHLQHYRSAPINYLEIGVQNGGSLQIAKKYFHEDSDIYGIDIDERICQNLNFVERITTFCFDASKIESVQKFIDSDAMRGVYFDVIIDDGSHIQAQIIRTFSSFFQLLQPGGVYIVEDLMCSYWSTHGGALLDEESAMEYFKKLVDIFNFRYMEIDAKDLLEKNHLRSMSMDLFIYYHRWLESVLFTESMVIVKKRRKPRNDDEGLTRIMTGNHQSIGTFPQETIDELKANTLNLGDYWE